MIEEHCRIYYNIGLELTCGLPFYNCLCPNKQTYEYLCYQCYLMKKKASKESYNLKFNTNSGEINIKHHFKHEILCDIFDKGAQEIIKVILEDIQTEIEKNKDFPSSLMRADVGLTALALTQTAFFRDNSISYIYFVDAFRTEEFLKHFWSLSLAAVEALRDEKDCELLLRQLCQCIVSINEIYEQRKKIGEQLKTYCKLIYEGLEKKELQTNMGGTFCTQQSTFVDNKIKSNSIEEFIFCSIDARGIPVDFGREIIEEFKNTCSVLKEYIISYHEQKNRINSPAYNAFIFCLNYFSLEEIDIKSLKGLEKINLQSAKACRANAGLVLSFLQKVRKRNCIVSYF